MKRLWWPAAALFGAALLVAACNEAQEAVVPIEVTRVVVETVAEEGQAIEVTRIVASQATAAPELELPAEAIAQGEPVQPARRLIVKNGILTVVVSDTERAVTQASAILDGLGGYIISQRVYDDSQGFRYAAIRLAVPVDQFEEAMARLRRLGRVTDESASGQDVTEEYVDLNSRLTNLEATRDRLRSFLDQAETVEQALEVNAELRRVEEEIAIIQGRIQSLEERAAFSTIDLNLEPVIPTPTPTPSPTPTPLPTAVAWRPGDTAQLASVRLQESVQDAADFTIYTGIVCGPWLLILAVFGFAAWWIARRFGVAPRPFGPSRPPQGGPPA
jgi:hypothetical protein